MPRRPRPDSSWTIRRFLADVAAPIAPLNLAQSWDNVGLLAGDESQECTGIMLCIDLTESVIAEALRRKANLLLAYHPPLFKPIGRLTATSTGTDRLIFLAISKGIAVYSMHTALDAAAGGTNDVLADLCGLSNVEPFEHVPTGSAEKKMVVFVPPQHADRVADAMFLAGAGRIGDYQRCSYRLDGQGTFFATDSTAPAVGRKGRLERVPEIRLETIVPASRVADVAQALRATHPYEEPAFDVYSLEPRWTPGIGRMGTLPQPLTLSRLARKLQRALHANGVQIVGPPNRPLRRVAICVGAAGRLTLDGPIADRVDATITGEIRHHDALAYLRSGQCAIALGHWASERPVLKSLQSRIRSQTPLPVRVSRADRDPFQRA